MENRYFVKVKMKTVKKEDWKELSFMIEANSEFEIEDLVDINHKIVEVEKVD